MKKLNNPNGGFSTPMILLFIILLTVVVCAGLFAAARSGFWQKIDVSTLSTYNIKHLI